MNLDKTLDGLGQVYTELGWEEEAQRYAHLFRQLFGEGEEGGQQAAS